MSSQKRKVLGKGFGALIPPSFSGDGTQNWQEIPIEQIKPNPKQPRIYFDQEKIDELAQSIKIKGVIQPIILRKLEKNGYELVIGERRFLAAKKAGLDRIPAVIKNIGDDEMHEIAIIENIQRENLNPIEEAKAYHNLMLEHNYTQKILSKRLGKNRSTIANSLRLLKLPATIQASIAEKKISAGHARSLLSIDDQMMMTQLFNEIILKDLSVREAEQKVKTLQNETQKKPIEDASDKRQYLYNTKKLKEHFLSEVRIQEKNNKGKIEFYFNSTQEFNKLFKQLLIEK